MLNVNGNKNGNHLIVVRPELKKSKADEFVDGYLGDNGFYDLKSLNDVNALQTLLIKHPHSTQL